MARRSAAAVARASGVEVCAISHRMDPQGDFVSARWDLAGPRKLSRISWLLSRRAARDAVGFAVLGVFCPKLNGTWVTCVRSAVGLRKVRSLTRGTSGSGRNPVCRDEEQRTLGMPVVESWNGMRPALKMGRSAASEQEAQCRLMVSLWTAFSR